MKKIGSIIKSTTENRIKRNLSATGGFFIIGYSQLTSLDMSALRQLLKNADANLFVVKNSVARKVFKDNGLEGSIKAIDGPCGMVFANGDPVGTTKVLCDFAKDHEPLKLQGGLLEGKLLEKADIEGLAKLPGKDALRALVVITLNSPLSRLARALNSNLSKLARCLDQIKSKKSG
jgi:large subunit ribosomal protein L10